MRTQDYTANQLRRFRQPDGTVVTTSEHLQVQANGSAQPAFSLSFVGVQGEPTGSALWQDWQQNYDRYARLFFRHGSFSIRDLTQAQNNYTLHDFGPVVRAGRAAQRLVIFPGTLDKAIWVVDVDSLTSVPLYVAELDSRLIVHAEIETTSFSDTVQTFAPMHSTNIITPMPDYGTALQHLGLASSVIDPNVTGMPDYVAERIEVHDDPINGQQKLVMVYGDGIDQFFVVQNINSLDPFDGMPNETAGGNTIARFRDPAVSALVFWDDNVTFHVAGRGSLRRLDALARVVFLQALSQ
ncbi:MAG: hypothetical protein AB8H80_03695 [Planctomycetota bacterium]